MRLAILHPFQFSLARGIERFTWALSESLTSREVTVDLLTWRSRKPVNWGAVPARMRIRQVPSIRYFRHWTAVPYYVNWLRSERYDWVMLFFAGYGEAEAMYALRRLRHQRYCVVFHYPREQVPHRYAEFERLGLARHADQLIAVSECVARGVEAQFGRSCAVVVNGVDPDAFRPSPEARRAVRQRLGLDQNAPVLISLVALEERKGVQWVIRALPRLLPEFPDLQYWVLGEGGYRTVLEQEIRSLDLEQHVRLLGVSDEVPSYLAAADIGFLLSYGEACPIALIEYMAIGLPIVTSCHPPFEEFVRSEWGERVQETDTATVAMSIRQLLRHPRRRCAMGRAGRQHVLQQHTWERVADSYLRLLSGGTLPAEVRP
jgi:glycosyltransferase involved in cell wall biosynthesis